jgi:hypothetical protein
VNVPEFQETLEFLAQTPQRVATLIAGFDRDALRHRPAPDAFSAVEQVCHLRDIEHDGYTVRVRRVLEENNPQLDGINGSQLALERDYQAQDAMSALAAFDAARQASLLLLKEASEADLARQCTLEGSTNLTLAGLAGLIREHDSEHLAELESLREGFLHAQESRQLEPSPK